MELKNAIAVCLIALFSAGLVVLIARSLDLQAASRLEPQLERIAAELEAIRKGGGITVAAEEATVDNGLIVYYFHGKARCPTCRSIESQARATVQEEFASELAHGELVWKILDYEKPANAGLAKRFEIQMPVVVLARMKDGQIVDWNRLDRVWTLVGERPAFREYVCNEIQAMLDGESPATLDQPSGKVPDVPIPDGEPNESSVAGQKADD